MESTCVMETEGYGDNDQDEIILDGKGNKIKEDEKSLTEIEMDQVPIMENQTVMEKGGHQVPIMENTSVTEKEEDQKPIMENQTVTEKGGHQDTVRDTQSLMEKEGDKIKDNMMEKPEPSAPEASTCKGSDDKK